MNELGMPPEMMGMAQSMFSNPAFVQVGILRKRGRERELNREREREREGKRER